MTATEKELLAQIDKLKSRIISLDAENELHKRTLLEIAEYEYKRGRLNRLQLIKARKNLAPTEFKI